MKASTIGLRGKWTCAECPATATTHQIAVPVANPRAGCSTVVTIIQLPPGWVSAGKETFCPEHGPGGRKPGA